MQRQEKLIPLMQITELTHVLHSINVSPDIIEGALKASGLPSYNILKKREYLTIKEVWQLFGTLIFVLDDELLSQASQKLPQGCVELIVGNAAHATSLEEVLERFCHSASLIIHDLKFKFYRRHQQFHIHAYFSTPHTLAQQIYLEIACIPWHCAFCWLSGSALPLKKFISMQQRASTKTQLSGIFGCPVEFTHEKGISLVYSADIAIAAIKAPPMKHFRHDLLNTFLNLLDQAQTQLVKDSTSDYVRHAIRSGIKSQSDIAMSAGISVGTLRRKLVGEDTSYRALLNEELMKKGAELLLSNQNVEETAELLGYSDGRSFRRAFKAHFGTSPTDYRKDKLAQMS